MRDFNDASRVKKSARIQIPNNPDNLSKEELAHLESMVKAALGDGYISCPVAWDIAKEARVTKIAVGEIADKLGIRITDCQIGFYKKEKTTYDNPANKCLDGEIVTMLMTLAESNQLTCTKIFELGQEFKLKPITIANEASVQGLKISGCQLGCF
ncbi:MAG: hypothetical protein JSV74_05405 [Dehalococcoidia bacterium]|nr:MAG: hypothetical protein JSV74_05405 [Dehalococcoidia bacterium]